MDDISTHLREAVGEPPPTTINLDRLIAAEQRRSRTRAWAGAATSVAAAVAAIVAVPILLTGPAPGGDARPGGTPAVVDPCAPAAGLPPSGYPAALPDTVRGRPTERADQAMPRLSTALLQALQASLPANVSVKSLRPGCTLPEFESQPDGTYKMGLALVRGEDTGSLAVVVGPTVADRVGCTATQDWDDCERVDLPDGTVVTRGTGGARVGPQVTRPDGTVVGPQVTRPGGMFAQTQVTRPDGTFVLIVDNYWTSQQPKPARERLLTYDQAITIGKSPSLTLYP